MLIPLFITAIAILGAIAGVFLTGMAALSRRVVAFSGGVLVGISLLWVLPEMAELLTWPKAIAWLTAGFVALWLVDRFVYSVCPTCSHSHDHDACATTLHGMAGPLLFAAALHSFFDGWSLTASGADPRFGLPFIIAIAIHKIPEGLALGVIVRAAMRSRSHAIVGCALAEGMTLTGAIMETTLAARLGSDWVHILLAIAGGSFLYLGYHAIHAEYERRGMMPAFVPALTGVAGSTVIRLFLR